MKEQYPEFQGITNFKYDLTNQVFGALTVLYRYYKNTSDNKIQWVCQCECGNYTIKTGKYLRKGTATSCGCGIGKQKAKQEEIKLLFNQTFGYLTPIDFYKKPISNKYRMICKCICGNICDVDKSDLIRGITKSCGCKSIELNSRSNITPLKIGYTCGKLKIIKDLEYIDNRAVYLCSCECGNSVHVLHTGLKNKTTTSCGCIKSRGELFTRQVLEELNLSFIQEYSFDNLKSNTNTKLKFDFAIFNNDKVCFLIEYDGLQHFVPYGWNTPDKLKQIQEKDQMKNNFCINNNIKLLRINYLCDSKEQIKQQIINFIKENCNGIDYKN